MKKKFPNQNGSDGVTLPHAKQASMDENGNPLPWRLRSSDDPEQDSGGAATADPPSPTRQQGSRTGAIASESELSPLFVSGSQQATIRRSRQGMETDDSVLSTAEISDETDDDEAREEYSATAAEEELEGQHVQCGVLPAEEDDLNQQCEEVGVNEGVDQHEE